MTDKNKIKTSLLSWVKQPCGPGGRATMGQFGRPFKKCQTINWYFWPPWATRMLNPGEETCSVLVY